MDNRDKALLLDFCAHVAKLANMKGVTDEAPAIINAFLAARQPQGEPEPFVPCPACNPAPPDAVPHASPYEETKPTPKPPATFPACPKCGAIAVDYDPKDCGCPPPAPQRWWRVIRARDDRWDAFACDDAGTTELGPSLSSLDGRTTREEAEKDGIVSGLPQWKP
jgi:hypothetical protein